MQQQCQGDDGRGCRLGAVVRTGWVQAMDAEDVEEWVLGGAGDLRVLGGGAGAEPPLLPGDSVYDLAGSGGIKTEGPRGSCRAGTLHSPNTAGSR